MYQSQRNGHYHLRKLVCSIQSKANLTSPSQRWPKVVQCLGLLSVNSALPKDFSTDNYDPSRATNDDQSHMILTDNDVEIIKRHSLACKDKKHWYVDPQTGYMVFTEFYHRERGSCCGNECRHCPYGHRNVPQYKRTMKFNSVFYR